MRQAIVLCSGLALSPGILCSLVHAQTALPFEPVTCRDVLVATRSRARPGSFEIHWWTSPGPVKGFVVRPIVALAPGTVTTIERDDVTGGDIFVAANLPSGSAIYSFVSPFTRMMRGNYDPPLVRYSVASPDVITDFKYDPPNATDANRSDSLVIVGYDTVTGVSWLRRVPLARGMVTGVAMASGVQHASVAMNPANGDIFVADDGGHLLCYTSTLSMANAVTFSPAMSFTDLMWDNVPARPDPLVASGTRATPALCGMFRLTLGATPAATPVAQLPAASLAVTVDGAGDGYCLVDQGKGQRELWQWDNTSGRTQPTNLPANTQAMAWSSRCTVEAMAYSPGTPISSLLVPPVVGDTGLTFQVGLPAGITVEPIGIAFSSRWTEQGPSLGTSARFLVDPGAPGFVFLHLPRATPPTVRVRQPIPAVAHGARVVSQFVWMNAVTKEPLTSWASNFVIGVRPVD